MLEYLALNFAILISYCFNIFSHKNINQSQKLIFARISFLGSIIIFLLMPILLQHFTALNHSDFQIQTFVQQASNQIFLQQPKTISFTPGTTNHLNDNGGFILISFLLGIIIFFAKYIKNILNLRKIILSSYCRHKIYNTHILFSEFLNIPLCFSFIRKHYVVLPVKLLATPLELTLALRHELQHLRQGDTQWLHILNFIKIFCFLNPFIWLWLRKFNELQEYTCDENLILCKKTSAIHYAQCLVDLAKNNLDPTSAPQNVLSLFGFSKPSPSILKRRITMLFNYKKTTQKFRLIIAIYFSCFLVFFSSAYALSGNSNSVLTTQQVQNLIELSTDNNSLRVTANPEVITELNNIRNSTKARVYMQNALNNMQNYNSYIQTELKKNSIPEDFLALPLTESGYRNLAASQNPVEAAGIWQFVPATAQRYGLVINNQRDDRLDTKLSTTAAINYLNDLYSQFKDWKLAAVAYEIGEANTNNLIKTTQSRDPWVLANDPSAPKDLKAFLALLDSSVILIHNPSLVQ